MPQLNNKERKESIPNGQPVKPKKPLPTKEEAMKIPVPCSVLTEERVREIARQEIRQYMSESARFNLALRTTDNEIQKGS